MADKVIYQDGDDLSETNLALMLAVGNQTDYKERGFGFSPDFTNNTLTIGNTDTWGNFAVIEDAKKAYYLFADQRTGLSLASSDVNYVYLYHDPTQDEHIDVHIDTDQTPPADPSLLIGTVDTANDTYDDTVNDDPGVTVESVGGAVASTAIQNFEGASLAVDADGNLDVTGSLTQVATGTVTASGGASPAVNTTLQGVSTDQLLNYTFIVYVDADPSFNADYAWNFDFSDYWDDTNAEKDIDLVVNWDTDPGSGNDVTLRWEVLQP